MDSGDNLLKLSPLLHYLHAISSSDERHFRAYLWNAFRTRGNGVPEFEGLDPNPRSSWLSRRGWEHSTDARQWPVSYAAWSLGLNVKVHGDGHPGYQHFSVRE